MVNPSSHPFDHLTPQAVLNALDMVGVRGDGRLLQLNSFENRVFHLYLEDGSAVVAKFYRPGRWSDEQIHEEHGFALELAAADVPIVAPLPLADGESLASATIDGQRFAFAVYPSRSGHGPELDDLGTLRRLGRLIGRLHAVGANRAFASRRVLSPATYGHAPQARLKHLEAIPDAPRAGWNEACTAALAMIDQAFAAVTPKVLRLHGDCHPGNILWREEGPHVVDLDDACTGPAVQDLWMLLSGSPDDMARQMAHVLSGYRQFKEFDPRELVLIEPLRTLRMIHHSAWLAERWDDPAFPIAFPWFGTSGYWSEQVAQLCQQIDAMAAPSVQHLRLD